jgi:3,4-dihydroxy 2-butanone 4-phosphate synthase/GTP cyclohydrolase II
VPDPGAVTPLRDFGLGAQVLAHLGVRTIRLLTNTPRRIAGLLGYGLSVVECVPSRPPAVVLPIREEEAQ